MIRKMCGWPGCGKAADGFYCEEHRARAERRGEERAKESRLFEGTRRKASAEWHSLYRSRAWRDMRLAFLAEHPVCAMCGSPATAVDHVTPHRGEEELFFCWENLQSLCQSCHSRKTLKENNYFHGRK